MWQSLVTTAPWGEPQSPNGIQEGEEYLVPHSHQTAATPYGEALERKLRMWKQDSGPR